MYASYKRAWLAQERRTRERLTPPAALTEPVRSWQIWRTDPHDVPPLVDGLAPSIDYAWTKMHLQDDSPSISNVLAFRPGVIFSAGELHLRGCAWVCPLTRNTTSAVPGAVAVETGGVAGMALPAFSRTVSTNTARDTRELVCTFGELPEKYRQSLLDALVELLAGTWADAAAPEAGTILSFETPWGARFGLVLAGFVVRWGHPTRREVPFALIMQRLGDSSLLGALPDDEASRLGLIIARTSDAGAEARTDIYALTTLRVVPVDGATVVGEARSIVGRAQDLLLRFLAEVE
jgi:hypothetical protein